MSKAFGSRYSIENSEEAKEYFEFVKDLLDSDVVNEIQDPQQEQVCFTICFFMIGGIVRRKKAKCLTE